MIRDQIMTDEELKQAIPYWEEESLTFKQLKFIFYYCNTNFNAKEAYRIAYEKDSLAPNLSTMANSTLRNPRVKTGIKRYLSEYLGVQKDKLECIIFDIYIAQATYLPSDIIDKNGMLIKGSLEEYPKELQWCIQSIETSENASGSIKTKVKLVDRNQALLQLQKYVGMMDTTINVNHTVDSTSISELFNKYRS